MNSLLLLGALGALAPDHARLQTGGFSGMVTVGMGYSVARDRVTFDLGYGWVPPRHGAPMVHIGTLLLGLRPLHVPLSSQIDWVPLYLTSGLFVGHGSPTRTAVVADDPVALWGLFSVGAELAWNEPARGVVSRHALYVEEVSLSPYLYAVAKNGGLHLVEAFSTALGYRASF